MNNIFDFFRALLPPRDAQSWIALLMVGGAFVMGIAAWLLGRSNARLQQRIDNRRRSRQQEAEAVETVVDALAGRPTSGAASDDDLDKRHP